MYSMFRELDGGFANNRPINTEVSDFSTLKIDKNVFSVANLTLDLDFPGIVIFSESQKEFVSYVAK